MVTPSGARLKIGMTIRKLLLSCMTPVNAVLQLLAPVALDSWESDAAGVAI